MREWVDTSASVRTDPKKLMLGLGLLPLLGISVFGVSALAYGARGWQLWLLAFAVVTGLVALVPLMFDQARPPARRHLLLTLIALAHGVYFVAPVFTMYLLQDPRVAVIPIGPGDILPSILPIAQLAVLVGFVAMLTGYALPLGRSLAGLLPEPRHEWPDRTAIRVALLGLPVGWAVFFAAFFGLIPFAAGTSVFLPIVQFPITAIILLGLVYLRSRSRTAFLLLVVLVPITMFFNFFSGSKGAFFAPLVMLVLAYIVIERRVRVRWMLGGFLAAALFYPAADFYRNVLRGTENTVAMLSDPAGVLRAIADFASGYSVRQWLVDGIGATLSRFDYLGVLALIMQRTPEHVPYQGGWTIGYIFLFPIPRAIWPDKPDLSIGRWVAENYTLGAGMTDTSVGSTWVGELYLNFGWLGIGFGMVVLGVLFRVLNESLFGRAPILPTIVAGITMVNLAARGLGGTLLGLTGIFWSLAPLAILHGVVRFLGGTVPRPSSARRSRWGDPPVVRESPKSPASV